jgi:hypothetical protein
MGVDVSKEPINVDYNLTAHEANELSGVVLLPMDIRVTLLDQYRKSHGTDALVQLFANFIGMANSVVENSKDSLWLLGVTAAKLSDREAENINVPTLFGALNGVKLAARVDQNKTCSGCAFRLGSLANQSPSTTCDAEHCVEFGEDRFMCHEDMNENDQPTRVCGGFAQVEKHRGQPPAETRKRIEVPALAKRKIPREVGEAFLRDVTGGRQ